jgi:hypothetical protein
MHGMSEAVFAQWGEGVRGDIVYLHLCLIAEGKVTCGMASLQLLASSHLNQDQGWTFVAKVGLQKSSQ